MSLVHWRHAFSILHTVTWKTTVKASSVVTYEAAVCGSLADMKKSSSFCRYSHSMYFNKGHCEKAKKADVVTSVTVTVHQNHGMTGKVKQKEPGGQKQRD